MFRKTYLWLSTIALCCVMNVSVADIQPRIIGGVSVDNENRYPWMVSLLFQNDLDTFALCGGTLIAQDWILTAAHCVVKDGQGTVFANNKVFARVSDFTLGNEADNEALVAATRIVKHPSYSAATYTNDIALIQIKRSSLAVTPIPLAGVNGVVADYESGSSVDIFNVMGWGLTDTNDQGSLSARLMEVTVDHVSDAQCRSAYAGFNLSSSQLCAGKFRTGGKDSCLGDSGGPLVFDQSGQTVQVGIVSFGGERCAAPFAPGVYTKVSSYASWIDCTINPSTCSNPKPTEPGSDDSLSGGSLPIGYLLMLLMAFGMRQSTRGNGRHEQ
ncbi:MAG: serine protease [Pseudomonadota bacterium]